MSEWMTNKSTEDFAPKNTTLKRIVTLSYIIHLTRTYSVTLTMSGCIILQPWAPNIYLVIFSSRPLFLGRAPKRFTLLEKCIVLRRWKSDISIKDWIDIKRIRIQPSRKKPDTELTKKPDWQNLYPKSFMRRWYVHER